MEEESESEKNNYFSNVRDRKRISKTLVDQDIGKQADDFLSERNKALVLVQKGLSPKTSERNTEATRSLLLQNQIEKLKFNQVKVVSYHLM